MANNNLAASKAKTKNGNVKYDSNPFTLSFSAMGLFFTNSMGWAIALIVLGVIGFIGNSLNLLVDAAKNNNTTVSTSTIDSVSSPNASVVIALVITIFVIVVVAIVVAMVVQTFVTGMFTYAALRSEEDKQTTFSEAFSATSKRFWRLLLSQLLANLKIFGWTLLFIIPGIVAGFRYQLLPYLIMSESEKEKGIGDSHNKTKSIVKGRLWELFGISFVAGIIPVVGTIIGLSGKAAAYNQLQASSKNIEARPRIHWLNYLGIILMLSFLVLASIIGIIVAIVIAANR